MFIANYNLDTDVVSLLPGDPQAAEYTAPKGQRPVRVVFQRNGVNVLLTNTVVSIVIRNPQDEGADYVANTLALTQGSTAAQGFFGFVNTDTVYGRKILNQTVGNTTPEAIQINLNAAVVLSPNDGSPSNESNPFTWILTSSKYRTDTPPANIIAVWPSADQLKAAIAQAAAAVKNGDAPTFSALTVSGNTNLEGAVNFPPDEQIQQDGGSIAKAVLATDSNSILAPVFPTAGQSIRLKADSSGFEPYTPNTGDGSGLTNLTPGNLSGPVPIAKGGTGASTAPAALAALGAAPLASPTFTGTVTIPAGAAIAGYAALASPTFTGTVTIPAGANINGYAQLNAPTFTGTVTIPTGANIAGYVTSVDAATPNNAGAVILTSDAAPNVGSKRTLGTGTNQALPGNTSLAPFHPVVWSQNGGSGSAPYYNNTGIAFGGSPVGGASVAEWTATAGNYPPRRISDTCGSFGVTISDFSTGASSAVAGGSPLLLATITFNTPYPSSVDSAYSFTSPPAPGQPGDVRVGLRLAYNPSTVAPYNSQVTPAQFPSVVFMFLVTATTLKIYLLAAPAQAQDQTNNPHTYPLNLYVSYDVLVGG